MAQIDFVSQQQFLRSARWPVLPKNEATFFTIAGIERKELPLSNVYAFFFRSDEKHGLHTLFGEALLSVVRLRQPSHDAPIEPLGQLQAAREYRMNKGQWLDILLHNGPAEWSVKGATFAILVENKIGHWLANDLANYWNSIPDDITKIGVVLGLNNEHPQAPWIYISHLELARAVEQRLGPIISRVNPRYLPVLLHFLEYLKHMSGAHDELAQAFHFAQRHRAELAQAQELLDYLKPERFAQTISNAFGNGYTDAQVLADYPRVRIHPAASSGIDYLVWFGDILDLKAQPSFSITLWPSTMNKTARMQLRQALITHSAALQSDIKRPEWFSDEGWFDTMLVGKDYPFYGTSLADLEQDIRLAFEADWKPLEPSWLLQPINS